MSPTKTKAHRRSEPSRSLASSAYLDFKFRLALQESSFPRGSTRDPNRALQEKEKKTRSAGMDFGAAGSLGIQRGGGVWKKAGSAARFARCQRLLGASARRHAVQQSLFPTVSQAPESIEATGHDTLLWIGPKEGVPRVGSTKVRASNPEPPIQITHWGVTSTKF